SVAIHQSLRRRHQRAFDHRRIAGGHCGSSVHAQPSQHVYCCACGSNFDRRNVYSDDWIGYDAEQSDDAWTDSSRWNCHRRRHRCSGKHLPLHRRGTFPPLRAAIAATDEIGLAVMATTLSLVVIFLPVVFLGGIPGRFLKSFGLTMAVSIMVSMLVSFTLTPMLSSRLLKRG